MFEFDSKIEYVGKFQNDWSQEVIKNEPMLFNCDFEYAWVAGGPITRSVLKNMPSDWLDSDLVIDTRVHMLMKNWYPCIPGFHHDDVPRSTKSGQPNYVSPEYKSEHIMALVNGDICATEFALGKVNFPIIPEPEIAYKKWHPMVVDYLNEGILTRHMAHSGELLKFDWNSWHQGTSAISSGWRFFFRASRYTERTKTVSNEIRRQVQVYLEHPMEGW